MEQEQEAAIEPIEEFMLDSDDHAESTETETATTESAPVENEQEDAPKEKPESYGFQKRIDKVTKDKFAEKQRADELQAKLDAIDAENAKKALVKPTLEQHDYDEDAFNEANINYEVETRLQAKQEAQKQDAIKKQQQEDSDKVLTSFNEQAASLKVDDFAVKVGQIPELPAGVAVEIMSLDNGAEMAYHLGNNLDLAESLAAMTPQQAFMQLGKISANLSTKPEVKLSSAPEPISTLKSGSSISKDVEDMSIDEFMSKHG